MQKITHIQSFVSKFSMMLAMVAIHVCLYCAYAMMIPILTDNTSIIFGRLLWDVLGLLCAVIAIVVPSMYKLTQDAIDICEHRHLSIDQTTTLVGFVQEARYVIWSVIVRLLTGILYVVFITTIHSKQFSIAILVINMFATFAMLVITANVLYKYSVNEIKIILNDAKRAVVV